MLKRLFDFILRKEKFETLEDLLKLGVHLKYNTKGLYFDTAISKYIVTKQKYNLGWSVFFMK